MPGAGVSFEIHVHFGKCERMEETHTGKGGHANCTQQITRVEPGNDRVPVPATNQIHYLIPKQQLTLFVQ